MRAAVLRDDTGRTPVPLCIAAVASRALPLRSPTAHGGRGRQSQLAHRARTPSPRPSPTPRKRKGRNTIDADRRGCTKCARLRDTLVAPDISRAQMWRSAFAPAPGPILHKLRAQPIYVYAIRARKLRSSRASLFHEISSRSAPVSRWQDGRCGSLTGTAPRR